MEQSLLILQKERNSVAPWQVQVRNVTSLVAATSALAQALRQAAAPPTASTVNAEWLLNLCQTVPTEMGAPQLARAIWSAAQQTEEAQQQAMLFDALGESGMDVLLTVAERLSEIRTISESDLGESSSSLGETATTIMDAQEQTRQRLLQEARDAAHVAAIAKAEADAMAPVGGIGTHTVTRTSEVEAQKTAKRAQKRADAALEAARKAGAILDEGELMTINKSALGDGGLMGQSQEAIWAMQKSLLPEGSREYNEKQGLPSGTEREYGEDFEKVTIPAPRRDETQLHERLRIADIMDSTCAQAFAGTSSLNPMQSCVFDVAFHNRDNMLVCAPTGAGKTNVAMLATVSHFRDVGLVPGKDVSENMETGGKKVVYIAPMKALAQEVVSKFHSKLNPSLRLIVRELTGDMQLTRAEAESANVIVTTPEKWDVVTRKSGNDEKSLGNQCGLLIIDEVHLLADERGAVIESVVARLHRLVESRQRQVRIVGLSATLPNYKDVATFLQVPERGLFYFGPEHRPVPLQQTFVGVIAQTRDRFMREKKMNNVCYDVVVDSLRRGYQVMVFVHSRKGTGDTANALAERAAQTDELERLFITQGKEGEAGEAHKRYADRVKKSRNREVGNHFANGIGIHHAGMLRGDRKLTEQMFADGAIKVLCCTATLAWGINLPAHTVVVKGTEVYNPEKGGLVDLSILDVMQIFGRAGRPQFDTSGEATLITSHDALPRYLDKLVRQVPIESTFIKQLPDHLNAEVVSGTVTNIKEAATWLTYTYLHVRMLRNPLAYGITADQKADDPMLRGRSVELVQDAARLLAGNEMVRYDIESGNLSVTDLGRTAAHYYIQAESVATFNEKLRGFDSLSDGQLAHLICCATEFENVKIRQEELNELDALAKNSCPLPVKVPIHDPSDKSLVLMQAFISRAGIKSFTLISDTNYIASNAGRVARAMFQMCLKQNKAGPTIQLLRIAKSVDKRFWWFQTPLRHFEGELKDNVFRAMESRSVGPDTFEAALSLLDMQHHEVGQLCHQAKNGRKIQRFVGMLPRIDVHCDVQPVTRSVLRFRIRLHPIWEWQNRWHGGAEAFWLWVEDGENDRIYHNEYVIFSRRTHPESVALDLSIPAFDPPPKQYFIRIVSDSWVGIEMLLPVSLRDVQRPSQKLHHTDLIDLTPLPTTALQNEGYEHLYSKIDTFNPIQTQLFHVLYHTDTPVLLGAPTGSGKTIVAELALLQMKTNHPNGICVYIAPLKSLARERLKEWKLRLGSAPLNWKVLELSGDTHHDQKALNHADVLVCTPEKWDLISRGWKGTTASDSNVANGKKFVKRVRLLVIDEIHLLGEERGAVLEAIVSRTRFISQFVDSEQRENDDKSLKGTGAEGSCYTRIVGLSTALANAVDLADWIGIDTKGHGPRAMRGLYNFRHSVRPIPMDVHIQGYAGRHYCPRMATMNKPAYAAIKEYSPNNPTLIFVASRRQTRLTAFDLISYAAGDENPRSFLGCSDDYIEAVAESIQDESLRHTITYGIGLHHAGLSSNDRDIVESLFLGGEIQVLVATATLAWGVNLPARFVIVKGTEYFDAKTSRYVDYPLTDVLQMIGRAGRPGFDTEGKALVMVEESKKSFYKRFLYLPFPVESCLEERMCENLNAEIAIGTINSIGEAVAYLSWTFYARRVAANPSFYGAASSKDEDVQEFLLSIVQETTEKLKDHGCVEIDKTDDEIDNALQPTILGKTASNYYLQYRTPKQMLVGVKEARRLIMGCIEESNEPLPKPRTGLMPFLRSTRLDELSVAWILYALSSTHEFDELPVRHNEEHLNAELAENVMWGADTSSLLRGGDGSNARQAEISLDVMADPHTKCFLLLQAYLEHAKMPISDYVNDAKTVVDQIPRLLGAMQCIALQETTAAGSFELACQFSRVRQILSTRTMVDENPWTQLAGVTLKVLRQMEKNAKSKKMTMPSLREVRKMPRDEAARQLRSLLAGKQSGMNADLLDSIYSLPLMTIGNIQVSQHVEKVTGTINGIVSLEIIINEEDSRRKKQHGDPMNLALVLGTPRRRTLLSYQSIGIGRNGTVKKSVNISFDWNTANADGGEDGGVVILRLLLSDVRGLDSEIAIPLR